VGARLARDGRRPEARLAPNDDRVGGAVAESLAALGRQREHEADEVEEERIDDADQVTDECGAEREVLSVLSDDADADHALPERRAGRRFADDVVADTERNEQQNRLAAEVDARVRVAVAVLRVAVTAHERDEDPE